VKRKKGKQARKECEEVRGNDREHGQKETGNNNQTRRGRQTREE
jgi:hypothetical protein